MLDDAQAFGALLRTDFHFFVERSFMSLHNGQTVTPSWHIRAMCWQLQQTVMGDLSRLIITVPPRNLKSICTSVCLPAWILAHDPSAKILVVSYAQVLADRHAADFRAVIGSDWYKRTFPRVSVRRNTAAEFVTTQNGSRMAMSAGGSITGFGADYIIIDDLAKADDASSDVELERTKRIYDGTLGSRLNSQETGRIIIIQQRIHEDDLVAHVLAKGGFYHLNLPAIAVRDEVFTLGVNWQRLRPTGEVLCPELCSRERHDKIRTQYGSFIYSAQYQQNPTPLENEWFQWAWFPTYSVAPRRDELDYVVQSWDTAFTPEPTSDFSVCSTWGIRNETYYLLDIVRARLDYSDLKLRVLSEMRKWEADCVVIEKAGCGISLIQELNKQGHRNVVPYTPRAPKDIRFATHSDKIRNGIVYIPQHAECWSFLTVNMTTRWTALYNFSLGSPPVAPRTSC